MPNGNPLRLSGWCFCSTSGSCTSSAGSCRDCCCRGSPRVGLRQERHAAGGPRLCRAAAQALPRVQLRVRLLHQLQQQEAALLRQHQQGGRAHSPHGLHCWQLLVSSPCVCLAGGRGQAGQHLARHVPHYKAGAGIRRLMAAGAAATGGGAGGATSAGALSNAASSSSCRIQRQRWQLW